MCPALLASGRVMANSPPGCPNSLGSILHSLVRFDLNWFPAAANWGCTRGAAQAPESSLHKSRVSSSGDTAYSPFFCLWTKHPSEYI